MVVPFNQASKQDVEALVDYIYANLGMDLNYILPVAGIPENGREIDFLDDKSELTHCMMLVNLLQVLDAIKNKKARHHFSLDQLKSFLHCLPIMPFWTIVYMLQRYLFQRWASKSWGEYLCLAEAVIR